MAILCLTRRKTQLELLAQVCEERHRARVVLPARSPEQCEVHTRFLTLQPDGVLLEWPLRGIGGIAVSGVTVDVLFDRLEQCFAFRTQTRGRVWWSCSRRGQVAAWKLGLPLRIEHRHQRQHYRASLANLDPVDARFTSTTDPQNRFTVQLQNLSAGGLSVTAVSGNTHSARTGDLFWAEFELPGEGDPFEFVVRIAHTRPSKRNDGTILGCMFCPGEDQTIRRDQLHRIAQFVTHHEKAKPPRNCLRAPGGT